ncbi:MAG: hypothetical protein Q7J32_11715 [Sphingomonadaceae bacterium]|nr:hypothetical protein [Sphingomonadaceae bacterium]
MFAMLMLAAAFWSSEPFPVAPGGDPDLARLHMAWKSELTTGLQRGEMDARIRAAAALDRPDWRAVADAYFAWRQADAAAIDARNAATAFMLERAAAAEAARPVVCTTETRTRPPLFGTVDSTSTTSCRK